MFKVILLFSCSLLFSGDIYVTLQILDQVAVVNSETLQLEEVIDINFENILCMDYSDEMSCSMADGCEWMMGMCMESDGGMQMGNNTPHFIAVDDLNGYWFTTTIASGYIARFELITNEFIDKIFVGDSPALLVLNKDDKKLYCSRMMPMGNMMPGSESAIIHEIDYSSNMLISLNEFEIPSPAPHGISINSNGSEVYVASNTADWIYKIIPSTGEIIGSVMDSNIDNPADLETQRLKPIQCLYDSEGLLFVTCSGGQWYDPFNGELNEIPGEVQVWDTNTMTKLSSYEFDLYSTPWHITKNPNNNDIYVSLSGDMLYSGSAGVASLSYQDSEFNLNWLTIDEQFETLHGITISKGGDYVYSSGRGDGHLHVLSSSDGILLDSIELSASGMTMAGGIAFFNGYEIGDFNNDDITDIFDILLLVSYIINSNGYNQALFEFSGDLNLDQTVNILDILELVSIILNN